MRKEEKQGMLFEARLRDVSWGKISMYLRCPLEYRLRVSSARVQFAPKGLQIEEGRTLHKLVEQFLGEPEANRTSTWLAKWISSWKSQHSSSYWSPVAQTLEAVSPYFTIPLLTNLSVLELEKNVSRPYKEFLLSGRVDCLGEYEGRLSLIDFKRDKREIEHLQDPVDKYLQLIFYAYCLSLDEQLETTSVELVNFFCLEGIHEGCNLDASTISQGLQRIEDIIHRMDATQEWLPRKNNLCLSCAVGHNGKCQLYEGR